MNNLTKTEIDEIVGKLYQYKHKKWVTVGYKCYFCDRHFSSMRKETYEHINKCQGKKHNKSLED